MYGKKSYRKNYKKASSRRRKKTYRKRRTVNVNRALQPFSQRYLCKLKYSGNFNHTPASPNIPYQFNLNSLYDPDATGTGHQPYGFDQLATMYGRYRVYAVKWHARVQAFNAANYYLVALPCNGPLGAIASFDDVREKPRSRYVVQMQNNNPVALRGRISLPSLVGKTKAQYMADDRFQAQVNSSPAESLLLNLFAYNTGALVSAPNVNITLELTYYVEFFDPEIMAQS